MNLAGAQQPIVHNLPFATRTPELQQIWSAGLQVTIEPKRVIAPSVRRYAVGFAPATPLAKGSEPRFLFGLHLPLENCRVTQVFPGQRCVDIGSAFYSFSRARWEFRAMHLNPAASQSTFDWAGGACTSGSGTARAATRRASL